MGVKDTANLALIPAAYKASKVYSALPTDGDGDFTFTRSSSGTRINKAGLIETMATNVPRLNYRLDADGTVSSCPELLLEPQRTNKLGYSEDFTNWSDSGVTVTANDIVAPNGTKTADKLASSANNWRRSKSFTAVNGTTYTYSIFAKLDTTTTTTATQVEIFKGASGFTVDFDLSNKTIVGSGLTDAFIEEYPNDWYRIGGTYTANGTNNIIYVYPSANYSVSGTMYFWGAQVEAGSYKTSYIPTPTASEATRNIDQAYKANFADLATDYPLTVYWKGEVKEFNGFNCAFSILKDGEAGVFLVVSFNTSSQVLVRRADGSGEDVDFITYNTQLGDVKKIAIKFTSATSFKLYIDGIEIRNESSGISKLWNFNSVLIGQLRIVADTGQRNPADELFIFNKALTDAEMVEVTSYTSFTEMATQQQYTIQ
jgi:hypothetical protein